MFPTVPGALLKNLTIITKRKREAFFERSCITYFEVHKVMSNSKLLKSGVSFCTIAQLFSIITAIIKRFEKVRLRIFVRC